MPTKRKRAESFGTKTPRLNAATGRYGFTPSGTTPHNVPVIDLRSPSPPTHLKTSSQFHRMAVPAAMISPSPVHQTARTAEIRTQPPSAPTVTRPTVAAEPNHPTSLHSKPYVTPQRNQRGQALCNEHRPQPKVASQSESQKEVLENATRYARTPNCIKVQPQNVSQKQWLENATRHIHPPPGAPRSYRPPQPVPSTYACHPKPQPAIFKPQILHAPHPDSKILQDFHWVPYPLGLLPYDSWHRLHNGPEVFPPLPFRCPVCRKERKVSAHLRKTYLVAERLSWEDQFVTVSDKNMNEALTWAVNYELGILDPFVEDIEQVPGGKHSQKNKFHPYQNEFEMIEALKLIFTTENITDANWNLWIGLQADLLRVTGNEEVHASSSSPSTVPQSARKAPLSEIPANARSNTLPVEVEEVDLTIRPQATSEPTSKSPAPPLPTPPSSLFVAGNSEHHVSSPYKTQVSRALPMTNSDGKEATGQIECTARAKDRRIASYRTLQDFYSLLDQIERTSYVGALFLEAYAERLRDDMCKDCWFKRYVEDSA